MQLLIKGHFLNWDALLTWYYQMKHLFPVTLGSLSCVSARRCSACRDGKYRSSEGHPSSPHGARPARSRTESHTGHPYLRSQGLTLHILGCEASPAAGNTQPLTVSSMMCAHDATLSIDSLSWIIHLSIFNLKFWCKVVLWLRVCLHPSLTRRSAGENKRPPQVS